HVPRQPAPSRARAAATGSRVGRRLGRLSSGVVAVVRQRARVLQRARSFPEHVERRAVPAAARRRDPLGGRAMSGARSLGRAELAVLGVGLGIAVTAMALASRGAFALLFTLGSFLFTLASLLFIGATSSHRTRWSRSWAAPRRGEASGLHVARLIVCCVVT